MDVERVTCLMWIWCVAEIEFENQNCCQVINCWIYSINKRNHFKDSSALVFFQRLKSSNCLVLFSHLLYCRQQKTSTPPLFSVSKSFVSAYNISPKCAFLLLYVCEIILVLYMPFKVSTSRCTILDF